MGASPFVDFFHWTMKNRNNKELSFDLLKIYNASGSSTLEKTSCDAFLGCKPPRLAGHDPE